MLRLGPDTASNSPATTGKIAQLSARGQKLFFSGTVVSPPREPSTRRPHGGGLSSTAEVSRFAEVEGSHSDDDYSDGRTPSPDDSALVGDQWAARDDEHDEMDEAGTFSDDGWEHTRGRAARGVTHGVRAELNGEQDEGSEIDEDNENEEEEGGEEDSVVEEEGNESYASRRRAGQSQSQTGRRGSDGLLGAKGGVLGAVGGAMGVMGAMGAGRSRSPPLPEYGSTRPPGSVRSPGL